MKYLKSILVGLTQAMIPVAVLAAAGITAVTHDVPIGGYAHVTGVDKLMYQQINATKPDNIPTWRTHGGKPGCQPTGELSDNVLVVTRENKVREMDFDHAFKITHDTNWANDVWVIGTC